MIYTLGDFVIFSFIVFKKYIIKVQTKFKKLPYVGLGKIRKRRRKNKKKKKKEKKNLKKKKWKVG